VDAGRLYGTYRISALPHRLENIAELSEYCQDYEGRPQDAAACP